MTVSKGVLYLEGDKFQLSLDTRADVVVFPFPPNLVSHLDIIDSDALKLNLTEFIKKNALVFTNLIIVLSSTIIFDKDFKTEEEEKIQEYLDNVPYETISIKKIPIQGGTKVLVGNATIYNLLTEVFTKNGAKLDFVIPEIALGAPIGAFNASTARLIMSKTDSLSQYKFEVDATTEDKSEIKPPPPPPVPENHDRTLIFLLPVIFLIFAVLMFFVIKPFIFKPKPKPRIRKTAIKVLPTVVPQPSAVNPVENQNTQSKVRQPTSGVINYLQASSAKNDQLKAVLPQLGITNIKSNIISTSTATPTVIFANDLDQIVKERIKTEVLKVLPNAVFQDTETFTADITINI